MTIPSFKTPWPVKVLSTPRIFVLQVGDKTKHDKPLLCHIIVERDEEIHCAPNGEVTSATITLTYRRIRARDEVSKDHTFPSFVAHYESSYFGQPRVSLTSSTIGGGAVFLDLDGLEGQHIGTFLMNEIVTWAKQWTTACVHPVSLGEGQAGDKNRERRNRFYEQFGLEFQYENAERRTGSSRLAPVTSLNTVDSWKENIEVVTADGFISEILYQNRENALDLKIRDRAVKDLHQELEGAKSRPFRWAFRQFWFWHSSKIILLFLAALAIVIIGARQRV